MSKVTITRREIDAALAHACTDAARYNLVSVQVSRKEGWTRLESTDGRRLIRIQHKEDGPAEYSELLNTQDLKTASKLITGAAANPNGKNSTKLRSFALSEKVKAEVIEPGYETEYIDAVAVLRTVSGQFPDTDMVLPDVVADEKEYTRICVNPQFLIDAAKALYALCSTDKINSIQIHVKDAISPLILTAEHSENSTRVTVIVMPIRDNEGVRGAPYPEREAKCENTE